MHCIHPSGQWLRHGAMVLMVCLTPSVGQAADSSYQQARQSVATTNTTLRQSQQQINKLDDTRQQLEDEYRAVLAEADTYRVHNEQLQQIVDAQNAELNSLQQQIVDIDNTARDVMPMMARMIDALRRFVELDVPFLPQERERRVSHLEQLMGQADVALAEKYRRILEAFQIEMDYGTTLEAYEGELDGLQVEFVRVGRLALYYQTPDGQSMNAWNQTERQWQAVTDSALQHAVQQAARMARKQQSPELLMVLAPAGGES